MTTAKHPSSNPGYFALISAGEPFRLLFPLGCLLGLAGVLLWPAFVWEWIPSYPGTAHARIMVEGFLTAFVVGFLGTALPRLLDVPRMRGYQSALFALGVLVSAVLHLAHLHLAGDLVFLGVLLGLFAFLASRIPHRKDTPPPGFVLVGLGLGCALCGGVLLVLGQLAPDLMSPAMHRFARLLLQEGYLLLPIMGIGAFLLPRFFGLPNRQVFPESLSLPPGWKGRAVFAAFCGGMVLVSFLLEACGWFRGAFGLRALAVALYFFREVPVHRARFNQGSLALSLRTALFFIPVGYLAMALWPQWQASLNHLVFMTGFGLLTFTVASRVILGHGGQSDRFALTLPSILALLILTLAATLIRVSADWMPALRFDHYAYAAVIWAVAVLIWAVRILPGVRRPDDE